MIKIPYFKVCERTGKYQARRKLTEDQLIKAAKCALERKFSKGFYFKNPSVAKDYLIAYFSDKENESFVCLFMDNQHGLISCEELFSGTINSAPVYPREVLKRSLEVNAAAVIFAHNHPAGICTPSSADKATTSVLKDALGLVDIQVLDHIVVGGAKSFSFAENNLV